MNYKLLLYETKKLFSFTFIKVLFVILLVINVYLCASFVIGETNNEIDMDYISKIYDIYSSDPETFYSEYERIERNYNLACEEMNENFWLDVEFESSYSDGKYWDYRLFSKVKEYIESDEIYHQQICEIISEAESIRNSLSQNDSAVAKYNLGYQNNIIELYSLLNERIALKPAVIYGWDHYFAYNTEFFFSFLFIIVAAATVAFDDRKTGFHFIGNITANGKERSAYAKCGAVAVVAFVTIIAFTLSSIIVTGIITGYSSPDQAIQAIPKLRLVCFDVSITGYLVILVFVRAISAVTFALIVLASTTALKSIWAGCVAGGITVGTSFAISFLETAQFGQVMYTNFWSCYSATEMLARYRTVNILGVVVPILGLYAFLLLIILICAVTVHIKLYSRSYTIPLSRNKYVASLEEKYNKYRQKRAACGRKRPYPTKLLPYEIYKSRLILAALIPITIIRTVTAVDYYASDTSSYERTYKDYIGIVGGEYSDEKSAFLLREQEKCIEVIDRYNEMANSFAAGDLSYREFDLYLDEYSSAQIKSRVLIDLLEHSDYLRELYHNDGIRGSFIYETGYNRFMFQGTDWYLIAFVLVLSCSSYSQEYVKTSSHGAMMPIIVATVNGRKKLFVRKLLVVTVPCVLAFAVFRITDFILLTSSFELPPYDALLVSNMIYSNASAEITIGEYMIFTVIVSAIGVLLISFLCFLFSFLLKETVFVYAIVSAIMLIPPIGYATGSDICAYINTVSLTNADAVFRISVHSFFDNKYVWFTLAYGGMILLLCLLSIISNKRLIKGENK